MQHGLHTRIYTDAEMSAVCHAAVGGVALDSTDPQPSRSELRHRPIRHPVTHADPVADRLTRSVDTDAFATGPHPVLLRRRRVPTGHHSGTQAAGTRGDARPAASPKRRATHPRRAGDRGGSGRGKRRRRAPRGARLPGRNPRRASRTPSARPAAPRVVRAPRAGRRASDGHRCAHRPHVGLAQVARARNRT